jgi:hypothetical protein
MLRRPPGCGAPSPGPGRPSPPRPRPPASSTHGQCHPRTAEQQQQRQEQQEKTGRTRLGLCGGAAVLTSASLPSSVMSSTNSTRPTRYLHQGRGTSEGPTKAADTRRSLATRGPASRGSSGCERVARRSLPVLLPVVQDLDPLPPLHLHPAAQPANQGEDARTTKPVCPLRNLRVHRNYLVPTKRCSKWMSAILEPRGAWQQPAGGAHLQVEAAIRQGLAPAPKRRAE